MTIGELKKLLSEYADDQYVGITLINKQLAGGSTLFIQGAKSAPPWHGSQEDRSKFLVGLIADADNRELPKEQCA